MSLSKRKEKETFFLFAEIWTFFSLSFSTEIWLAETVVCAVAREGKKEKGESCQKPFFLPPPKGNIIEAINFEKGEKKKREREGRGGPSKQSPLAPPYS